MVTWTPVHVTLHRNHLSFVALSSLEYIRGLIEEYLRSRNVVLVTRVCEELHIFFC